MKLFKIGVKHFAKNPFPARGIAGWPAPALASRVSLAFRAGVAMGLSASPPGDRRRLNVCNPGQRDKEKSPARGRAKLLRADSQSALQHNTFAVSLRRPSRHAR
ncbi:hypothetical protein CT19431_190139 [Cupriavidus taiwanensis]|nr:hypothetical protein CT19431_190139 [Cupriavidus taiwanensis]